MIHFRWRELAPDISYVNHLACTPGFAFGPRFIGDFQFIFVAAGKGSARIQANRYDAEAGDLYYYGPGIVHEFWADEKDPFTLYGVHFRWNAALPPRGGLRPPDVTGLAENEPMPERVNRVIIGEQEDSPDTLLLEDRCRIPPDRFIELFSRLTEAYQCDEEWGPVLLRARFLELLVTLRRHRVARFAQGRSAHDLIQSVAEQLSAHANCQYDRSWLSDWTSYHPDHVSRLFRTGTGMTPYAYFMNRKLELAKFHLSRSDDSIGIIADKVGIGTIHTFSRWFKQVTDMSPMQYRQWSRLF